MSKLTGLTRRINTLAYDRATSEELSHLVEESSRVGEARAEALIELVLAPLDEDVDWSYGAAGHAEVIRANADEFDKIGDGDDDATEDGSGSVDDYVDPDDDVEGDGDYGTGGFVDPDMMDGVGGEDDDVESTDELDAELADLEADAGDDDEDGDDGDDNSLDEGAGLGRNELPIF
jgi:hypothetical protein